MNIEYSIIKLFPVRAKKQERVYNVKKLDAIPKTNIMFFR